MSRILTACLVFLIAISTFAEEWQTHYQRGIALIRQGKASSARSELEKALKQRSGEGLQVAVGDGAYIDYLPHLYLAIAAHMSGEVAEARKQLAVAEATGMAQKSEVGRPLLVAYQLLLGDKAAQSFPAQPRYDVYKPKSVVLSEDDYSRLKGEVLSQCGIDPSSKLADAPWYVPYELALELARKHDYQRSVDLLVEAAKRRPNPQSKARTYGMWLIDYYPYFHIARAHAELENWECAANAIEISERLGEISTQSKEFTEFMMIKQRAEKKLGQ